MWNESLSLPQRQRRTSNKGRDVEENKFNKHSEGPSAANDESEAEHSSPALRSSAEPGCSYEYLDHTADIQIHAWGASLEVAFENAALAMYNYMTPLSGISCNDENRRKVTASGHDVHALLFNFLDELLYIFNTEFLVLKELSVTKLDCDDLSVEAVGRGEIFDRRRHASGTEIKAITYSAMQVTERTSKGDSEVFVIVDI